MQTLYIDRKDSDRDRISYIYMPTQAGFEPGWQPMTGQILDNSSSVQWLAFCLAQAFDFRKENFAVESGYEPRSKGIKTPDPGSPCPRCQSGHEPRSKG